MPLIGVLNRVKYTTFGLKKGKMVAVASRFCAPKITVINDGMPTKRQIPHTTLAMEFEFGICRNRSRSKARPSKGDKITTETTKAGNPDQCSFWVRMVTTNAAAKACAPKAKLKTPVA